MSEPGYTSHHTETRYDGRGSSEPTASHDAEWADLINGVTNKTQRLVLILAKQAGSRGVTVAEVREKQGGLHHGRISSALTKQHIAGRLVALTERRAHSGVYVLPEYVNGREIRPYRRQTSKLTVEQLADVISGHAYESIGYRNVCGCGAAPSDRASHDLHLAQQIMAAIHAGSAEAKETDA